MNIKQIFIINPKAFMLDVKCLRYVCQVMMGNKYNLKKMKIKRKRKQTHLVLRFIKA